MKKIIALLIALVMVFALCACGSTETAKTEETGKTEETAKTEETGKTEETATSEETTGEETAAVVVKAGFIFLHDENSTYDLNFINAAKEACEKLGVEYLLKTGIPEGQECYDAAAELVDEGCNFIFADSFGHEPFLIQAAKEFPEVQFFHATGTKAHTEGLANYHNGFASIYEGRFLGGVAAGDHR